MVERNITALPRRAALIAVAALTLGGPAIGQGPFPPVPGPYQLRPEPGPAQVPAMSPAPAETAGARPQFQPPANALRLPYWMQAPVPPDARMPGTDAATLPAAEQPASVPAQAPSQTAPAGQQGAAPGYGWPMPSWGPAPFGVQPPWGGQPMQGPATGQPAPGWGYMPGPFSGPFSGPYSGPVWGATPAQPGWGAPTTGVGQ